MNGPLRAPAMVYCPCCATQTLVIDMVYSDAQDDYICEECAANEIADEEGVGGC